MQIPFSPSGPRRNVMAQPWLDGQVVSADADHVLTGLRGFTRVYWIDAALWSAPRSIAVLPDPLAPQEPGDIVIVQFLGAVGAPVTVGGPFGVVVPASPSGAQFVALIWGGHLQPEMIPFWAATHSAGLIPLP